MTTQLAPTRRRSLLLGLLLAATLLAPAVATAADPPSEEVHSFSRWIPIGPGQRLFVTEYFSQASLLRQPARAVIFLTGPEFRGNFWSIPVEGYSAPVMAARRGFFAYTFDYVGVGESYRPENGFGINYLTQVGPLRQLIDFVRSSRQVAAVDLVGEGYGAEIGAQLADDPERVRSLTMTVIIYKTYHPDILPFFSPEFEAFLRSQPNGYWEPNFLHLTLAFSPNPQVREYVFATQPGVYPVGPGLAFWDLERPVIDAPAAQIPGLVISSELDPFPAPGDNAELAAEWGGGATQVIIPGAHHVPRIEAEPIAAQYYEALFGFIDP